MMRAPDRRGVLLLAFVLPALAIACGGEPVVVGKDGADLDACGGTGVLVRDSTLFPAPQDRPEFQQGLTRGARVFVCDGSPDGHWTGVVVPDGDEDCGVSSPVAAPRPYDGACRSGWVKSADIEVVAG
jgi:hypothetical protein